MYIIDLINDQVDNVSSYKNYNSRTTYLDQAKMICCSRLPRPGKTGQMPAEICSLLFKSAESASRSISPSLLLRFECTVRKFEM